jgi:acetyltransferase-like isoleucine patch superfamily enzyme
MSGSRKRLADRFPQLQGRSDVPFSFFVELALKCSILKTAWYSIRFKGLIIVGRGSRIKIHRTATVTLQEKSVLVIGMAHDTPTGSVLRLSPRSSLQIGGRVQIMRACNITLGYDAKLIIGNDTYFNDGSSIICHTVTTIGSGCAISWGVRILDSDIHKLARGKDNSTYTSVCIGNNCWIGTNALVLKGAQLGDGSVVAAGAIVTSTVPAHCMVAGVPAKIVRQDVQWTL